MYFQCSAIFQSPSLPLRRPYRPSLPLARLNAGARKVFLPSGRLLEHFALTQADFTPTEDGGLPTLYLSQGEPFIDGRQAESLKVLRNQVLCSQRPGASAVATSSCMGL